MKKLIKSRHDLLKQTIAKIDNYLCKQNINDFRYANQERIYLKPGEKPPEGVFVQRGKRGGIFYIKSGILKTSMPKLNYAAGKYTKLIEQLWDLSIRDIKPDMKKKFYDTQFVSKKLWDYYNYDITTKGKKIRSFLPVIGEEENQRLTGERVDAFDKMEELFETVGLEQERFNTKFYKPVIDFAIKNKLIQRIPKGGWQIKNMLIDAIKEDKSGVDNSIKQDIIDIFQDYFEMVNGGDIKEERLNKNNKILLSIIKFYNTEMRRMSEDKIGKETIKAIKEAKTLKEKRIAFDMAMSLQHQHGNILSTTVTPYTFMGYGKIYMLQHALFDYLANS